MKYAMIVLKRQIREEVSQEHTEIAGLALSKLRQIKASSSGDYTIDLRRTLSRCQTTSSLASM
jgi:hypothetical protein